MQSLARGHTEPDLHGPGVTQRRSRADGDGCAASVTETRLPHPQPQIEDGEDGPAEQSQHKQGWGCPMLTAGLPRKTRALQRKWFLKKAGENPDLN